MIHEKFFPFAMIALSLGAAMVYLQHGDIRRVCYWLCAAGLCGWLVLRATSEQVKSGKAIAWLVEAITGGEQYA